MYVFLFLLISHGVVACNTKGNEASGVKYESDVKVNYATLPRNKVLYFSGGRSSSATKCGKPSENNTYYGNCRPEGSDDFPAARASCDCARCPRKLSLTCHNDGQWYLVKTGVCEPNVRQSVCDVCKSTAVPDGVQCDVTSRPGYLGEVRRCTCRSNCLDVNIICGFDSTWRYRNQWQLIHARRCRPHFFDDEHHQPSYCNSYNELRYCTDILTFNFGIVTETNSICELTEYDQVFAPGMNVSLRNQTFSFSCDAAGYALTSAAPVNCTNGTLLGMIPSCVSQQQQRGARTGESAANTTGHGAGEGGDHWVLVVSLSSLLVLSVALSAAIVTAWCCGVRCKCCCRGNDAVNNTDATELQNRPKSTPNEYQRRKVEDEDMYENPEEAEYDDVA